MSRRRLLLLLPVVVLALFAASSPAVFAAYAPLWSQPVAGMAQLVPGDAGVTVVWAVADGASNALVAQRYDRAGEPLGAEPAVLVAGISGLSDWLATGGAAGGVIVVWKAGGVTSVRRVAASGAGAYGAVTICSDAAVAALRGPGATAAPVQLAADGFGGVYVRLLATPSLASGDTLLTYISPLGAAARPDPGLAVDEGTVAGMSSDDLGHLCVLLGGPGRNGVAAQRFAPDLSADWVAPMSPYNPLLGPPPTTAQTPLGIVATSSATTAWREGGKVKVQRFTAAGDRLWLRPVAVGANEATTLADDAWGGCYLASASPDGLRVHHIAAQGALIGDPDGSVLRLGSGDPVVDDVSWNSAGDLAVAYSDGAASAGVARMTYLGTWSSPALDPAPSALGALGADGAGGDYALGEGAGARLWRLSEAGAALTLRPRASHIVYGETVGVAGYLTAAGVPLAGGRVEIRRTDAGGVTTTATTATTDGHGFYEATIAPQANAAWTAAAAGPAGQTIVSETFGDLKVAPEVMIALAEQRAGNGYVETFSGTVKPAHAGSSVFVQRLTGGAWRTLASGSLDGRSRYRISWPLPLRSATYLFRTLLPTHADHAAGVSRTARLRVVLNAGG
ncbi:MAG: hypothetical protein NTW58_08285 [Actinobacteria bacterium]|nr:hypothetical protein [Actinomycetota bacterium]